MFGFRVEPHIEDDVAEQDKEGEVEQELLAAERDGKREEGNDAREERDEPCVVETEHDDREEQVTADEEAVVGEVTEEVEPVEVYRSRYW